MYTLLIVDDAKDAILLLQFDLTNAGYNVLCAHSGTQALDLLHKEHIDMVLLDIHMPEMSGLAVLKSMKEAEKTKNIPVIMLSASDDEDEIVTSLELGAVDHVTKPYINKVLLARINTAFRLLEVTRGNTQPIEIPSTNIEQDQKQYIGIDKNIGINNVLGDENLFKQVLMMFYEDHAQDVQKLKAAFAEQDVKTAKHIAHTLKGVASSIGAMELFNAAKALDMAINQQDEKKYSALTEQVSKHLSIVTQGIKALNSLT